MAAIFYLMKNAFERVKPCWPYIAIAAAVFYVFFRTLFFDYTYLDDNVLILNNNWFLRNAA